MAVTLQQIADMAGVSRGTVDRALNNRGRIRPEVEQKIKKIAKELGYQPSRAGRALAMAKKNLKTLRIESASAAKINETGRLPRENHTDRFPVDRGKSNEKTQKIGQRIPEERRTVFRFMDLFPVVTVHSERSSRISEGTSFFRLKIQKKRKTVNSRLPADSSVQQRGFAYCFSARSLRTPASWTQTQNSSIAFFSSSTVG